MPNNEDLEIDFEEIEFKNNQQPPINATFLNELQSKIKNNLTNMINYIKNNGDSLPIGSGMDYFGTTAPENYLFANGQAVSRTTYAALFAIIGTTYGTGDGSTTFNLPDKRERVSVMRKEGSTNGTTGATMGTLGAKGGEFKHTITISEMPSHSHGNVVTSLTTDQRGTVAGSGVTYVNGGTEGNTNNTGGGESINITQPYLVCNYIIKVK